MRPKATLMWLVNVYCRLNTFCQRSIITPNLVNKVGPWLFLLEVAGLCYFGNTEIIPFIWKRRGQALVTLNQGFVLFLGIEILINWICVRYVLSYYDPDAFQVKLLSEDDNPKKYSEYTMSFINENRIDNLRRRPTEKERKRLERENSSSKRYFRWSKCQRCDIVRPARCHHCILCNTCILARDHHCFFTGNCVGYKNLRHFFVLLVYSMYASVYAFVHSAVYYYIILYPQTNVFEIFPFVTFVMNLFGHSDFHTGVLILMWWGQGFFLLLGAFQLIDLLQEIPEGISSFEFGKGIELSDSRTLLEKIRAVFGKYWLLNFVLPVHTIFPPLVDPVNWPTISGIKRSPDEYIL